MQNSTNKIETEAQFTISKGQTISLYACRIDKNNVYLLVALLHVELTQANINLHFRTKLILKS